MVKLGNSNSEATQSMSRDLTPRPSQFLVCKIKMLGWACMDTRLRIPHLFSVHLCEYRIAGYFEGSVLHYFNRLSTNCEIKAANNHDHTHP